VQIDEPRGDDQPTGIEHLVALVILESADPGDAAVADGDIVPVSGASRAVHDGSTTNDLIEFSHDLLRG
jgi:hypothetical protein